MRDDLFAGTRTTRRPPDLRERVLRAARAVARDGAGAPVPRWGFTRLDLAWVALLAVLLPANLVLSVTARSTEAVAARSHPPRPQEERVARLGGERDPLALGLRLEPEPRPHTPPAPSLQDILRTES